MKKIIFILYFLHIHTINKGQTYRQLFDKLNLTFSTQDYSFDTQLVNSRVETNAAIMEAYLNMYDASKDIKYLNEFMICSKRTMDRRDDFLTSSTPLGGVYEEITCDKNDGTFTFNSTVSSLLFSVIFNNRPAWSKIEFSSECLPQPYPHFKESGSITFPMARFVLLLKENPDLYYLNLPNEINSSFNNINYGGSNINFIGQYADWLKSRVYETLNFHYNYDWNHQAERFATAYSDGKGYNLQCAIGKTLIIMNYIAYLENDNATVAAYTNVIEKIAAYLYYEVHTYLPPNPPTVGNGLLWYTWRHYEGDTLFEDISHAMLDEEFSELYMNYFHPVSGYGRFDITDMQKFANGFAYRIVANPHELRMNTYGTNCNCNQMCCFCDVNIRAGDGSGCPDISSDNKLPSFYEYQSGAYTFLTQYNKDIYQQIADFYMPGNSYEIDANVPALHAYSLLAKYQNVFNPITVNRETWADSHWAGCAGGDFDGDGNEEFATVRNKDGTLEIFKINSDNIITQAGSIINHPNNWAGVAAGKVDTINGEVIFAVNNGDNSIYAYQYNVASVVQIGGITTSYNDWKGIAVGDVVNSNAESEIAVLKSNGLVALYKYLDNQFILIANIDTYIGSAVGITIGEFDIENPGNEIAIINNSNGHLNIYKLDNSNGYSLQLINSFTACNGTYNEWNGLTSGDYDNDGIDEIIAHRNYDGDFYVFKITNGQLLNNYTECFPTNTQHGVMGTIKYKGKDALLALRNYDGNMFMFTLDGYCPCLDVSSNINQNNSIDNDSININNHYNIDYHSNNTLTASNMVISTDGTEVVNAEFVSGKEIIFKPGFSAIAGVNMDAYIDQVNFGCDNNSNLRMANQPNNLPSNNAIASAGNIKKEAEFKEPKIEIAALTLQINPNPNEGIFTIQLNKQISQGKVTIYDCLSKPIAAFNLANNSSFVIDISAEAKGIYFVQFIGEDLNTVKRIVKN